MLSKAPSDIILLSAHSTLGESSFMNSEQAIMDKDFFMNCLHMITRVPPLQQSFLHTSHWSFLPYEHLP